METDRIPKAIDETDEPNMDELSFLSEDSGDDMPKLEASNESEDEDCMILEDITDCIHYKHTDNNAESDEFDDEIEFLEERPTKQSDAKTEIIDVIDDEDDCVIVPNIKSTKSDITIKITDSRRDVSTAQLKRSHSSMASHSSAQSSTQSSVPFIPLICEPSTSSGYRGNTHQWPNREKVDWFLHQTRPKNAANVANLSTNTQTKSIKSESKTRDTDIPFLCEDVKPSVTQSEEIEEKEIYETIPGVSSGANSSDIDLIASEVKLEKPIVNNVLHLIQDDCTIPFIVRYRQTYIRGIDADKVRQINSLYNELKSARERAKEVEASLRKQNRLTLRLQVALKRCKNVFEVEHLYRLCCNESEESERARNLGLGDSAFELLEGKLLDPNYFVNRFAIGLTTVEQVSSGWSAIIVDIISKDCDVLDFLIATYKQHLPSMEIVINPEKVDELRRTQTRTQSSQNEDLIQKYVKFSNFKKVINKISAHCLMAIERGEKLGLLIVHIEFPIPVLNKLMDYCLAKWDRISQSFLANCVRKAWNNYLKPSTAEYIRYELRHTAHMTALEVFRNNVKHLLLEPPLRGETVIGVDPGFDNGCKLAVVSAWGVPLQYKIVKLDTTANYDSAAYALLNLMKDSGASIIALGNGTGCRKFEDLLLQRIRSGFFKPINVRYKIVSESGVSWYSVTHNARQELPNTPPHIIGAISIARRLQDPMSELVKVDPKRLQVGMYMRDIDANAVQRVFDEVALECVSFCGVDVNVASYDLLSKVAGIGPDIARLIIDKRTKDGLFTSRSQLKNINGLSWKQFEQCAGFVKIMPATSRLPDDLRHSLSGEPSNKRPSITQASDDYDPFDSTIIHPESYASANIFLELICSSKDEIGKITIKTKIVNCFNKHNLSELAEQCNTNVANMKFIIECMRNRIDTDYRIDFKQLYVPDIQYFYELKEGRRLKGKVLNVTPMGAFIDCGIAGGISAYLSAKQCEQYNITVNDIVLVVIIYINKEMQRFRVRLLKKFENLTV